MVKETIFSVDTAPAVKNIGELKEVIRQYKKDLEALPLAGEEYQETLAKLKVAQNALKDAMYATTGEMKDITNAATGANVVFDKQNQLVTMEGVSYNALVHSLAELKQQWRATTDEADRAKLGERINAVNNQLKRMDASVGNYQRNVGSYQNIVDQLGSSFGIMGKGAAAVINPIKGATSALKVMSATPAVAILGVLANVLAKVIGALKSSEENTQAMSAALAPFKAIGDAVTKMLQGLGGVIVKVAEGFGRLTASIFGTNEATKERLRLAQQEATLAEQQRQTIVANAEAEREVARLRAEASDKINNDAEKRIALLEEAGQKEKEISERAVEDARMQYDIIKAKNALTQSSKEELDKEAQAYAALVKAETDYYKKIREINAGITEAKRAEVSAHNEAVKAAEAARKAEVEAYDKALKAEMELQREGSEERLATQKELLRREYDAAVKDAKDKIKNEKTLNRTLAALRKKYHLDMEKAEREHRAALLSIQIQGMENEASRYAAGTKENLRALKELRLAELESLEREEGETEEAFNARRLSAQWAYYEAVRALNEKIVGETTSALTLAYAESAHTTEQTLAYEMAMAEARVRQIETLGREAGETETAYLTRVAEARKAAADATASYLDYEEEQEHLTRQNRLAALREGSAEYLREAVALKKYELDALHKTEEESEEEFRARQLAAEKEYYEAKKTYAQTWVSSLSGVAGNIGSIFGSIADYMEANTDATEEEAKKVKNLRLATAYIDMFQGIATAFSTAHELGPILGPITGAANAAAVLATGMANIAKIKATQVSTAATATGADAGATQAVVAAPVAAPAVQQMRTITSASEEDRLNRMADGQRVYILSSDLEADRNATRARVAETTF